MKCCRSIPSILRPIFEYAIEEVPVLTLFYLSFQNTQRAVVIYYVI